MNCTANSLTTYCVFITVPRNYKRVLDFLLVTSAKFDQFSKFFHHRTQLSEWVGFNVPINIYRSLYRKDAHSLSTFV